MAKKIRDSLSTKVFLWIAGLLILCSLLIYAIVMIFLPQSYTVVASSRIEEEIQRLTEKIPSQITGIQADSWSNSVWKIRRWSFLPGQGKLYPLVPSVNQTLASQFIFLDSRNNNLRQNRMNFFGLEQGLPYSRLSMKEYSCS